MTTDTRLVAKKSNVKLSNDSVVIGVIVGFGEDAMPSVSFPGCPIEEGISARTTVGFSRSDIGRQVALLFESGDMRKPVAIGKIQVLAPALDKPVDDIEANETTVDGERLTLTANREIVLQCGKASITLTRAGKIVVRGTYVLNRSSGVNKIKGASVQIN